MAVSCDVMVYVVGPWIWSGCLCAMAMINIGFSISESSVGLRSSLSGGNVVLHVMWLKRLVGLPSFGG